MKTKELRVTDILLDTGNYRTGKQDDQRKAINALIEEQKGKLVVLPDKSLTFLDPPYFKQGPLRKPLQAEGSHPARWHGEEKVMPELDHLLRQPPANTNRIPWVPKTCVLTTVQRGPKI